MDFSLLVESAKKDLEEIKKNEYYKEKLGPNDSGYSYFLKDCVNQLKSIIEDPEDETKDNLCMLYGEFNQYGDEDDPDDPVGPYSEPSDWIKLMPNTIRELNSLGIEIRWMMGDESGGFDKELNYFFEDY